jgi:phosphohistidine phosphatase
MCGDIRHHADMRVIFFRHGIAHDRADPACPPDPDRALTEDGRKKTKKAAKGLGIVGCKPTRIVTSPYLRARQTAEIAAETFGIAGDGILVSDSLLPHAAPYSVFHALRAFAHTDVEIICVGHSPHLDRALALSITGDRVPVTSLKKAGAALLELDELPRPHGELVWLMPPKVLVELA